jgi:NTE family protein
METMDNMVNTGKKTFGLALSGSGDRTSFYIGFLESLNEAGVQVDYISACSGASLVAAAYACGKLEEVKKFMLEFNEEKFKSMVQRSRLKNGGLYSLSLVEEELLKITQGKSFEEMDIKMSFAAVDIESGELVYLCMGDIAKAAVISCTLPGVFEPTKWGNRTLVDGGLLVMIPSEPLSLAGVDVKVGVNMRGTKHIFTEGQMSIKKTFNVIKKFLLIDYIEKLFHALFKVEEEDGLKPPHLFSVLGKSMDLAIKASQAESEEEPGCDFVITPDIPSGIKKGGFEREYIMRYYELGRVTGKEYVPRIRDLLNIN